MSLFASSFWNRGRMSYAAGILGILLACLLLVWLFDWKIHWVFATAVPLLYLFLYGYRKRRGIGVAETVILLLGLVVIGIGPKRIENKLRVWISILEDQVDKGAAFKLQTPVFAFTFGGKPDDPGGLKDQRVISSEKRSREVEQLLTQRQPLNVIRNGDFLIPLNSALSPWGHGHYTDRLRAQFRRWDIVWFNFLAADIDVQIAQTEIGSALRIEKRTGIEKDKVGIMEQYIRCEPGEYRLSLSAKGESVQLTALCCRTTTDWRYSDENNEKIIRGLNLPEKQAGTFPWQHFEQKVRMDGGVTTFTIVSQGRGILYLTDISLIRVGD